MGRIRTAISMVLAALVANPAYAREVEVAYSGYVSGFDWGPNTDTLGLFGAKGADLTGLNFTAKYEINLPDQLPSNITYTNGAMSGYLQVAEGDLVNSLVTASITINGMTDTLSGDEGFQFSKYFNTFQGQNYTTYTSNLYQHPDDPYYYGIQLWFSNVLPVSTGGLNAPFSFNKNIDDPNNLYWSSGYFRDYDSTVSIQPMQLNLIATAMNVSAVPEPEAWALMILGFGAVGSMLRYRRTKVNYRLESRAAAR